MGLVTTALKSKMLASFEDSLSISGLEGAEAEAEAEAGAAIP